MLRELLIEIGIDIDNDPISELNKEIDDLVKKLKKLDVDDIEDLDEHFKEIVESTEDINKNLKKMERSFKDINKETAKLERNMKNVSDEVRDAERRTDNLNDALRSSERRTEDVSENLEEVSDNIKEANRAAERLSDSFKDAERQASRLSNELDNLQGAFRDINNVASRLSRELNSVSFNGLQSEISRLESAFGGIVRAAQRASTEAADIGASAAGSASDVSRLERAFERVNQTVERINNGVDGIGNAAIGAAGAVGAGMGVQGVVEKALASTSLDTKLSIATDVSPETQKAMRQAINDSVAMGVDDISAFEGVRRQFSLNADAGVKANQEIVESASAIAAAYDMVDFTELIQEVNEIGKELKISDKEAVAMTNSLLKGGFPPEQLDIISEYGAQLQRAGFEAKEIQGIMSAGVATGTWNIDNLLDGVKEGRIRMAEYARGYPDAITDMLDELNLSSKVFDKWAAEVAAGGEAGSIAMQEVSEYIKTISDPALKNEMGVAVFGTMWEDQGEHLVNTILNAEDHMKSLSDMQKQLNEDVGKLSEDPAVQLAKAFKDINTALQPLYKWVSGVVVKFAEWISANPVLASRLAAAAVSIGIVGAALVGLAGTIGAVLLSIGTLSGTFKGIKNWIPKLGGRGGADVEPGGGRRTILQEIGGNVIETVGGGRRIDAEVNRNRPKDLPVAPPFNGNPHEGYYQNGGKPIKPVGTPLTSIPSMDTASKQLLSASNHLKSAAKIMERALSNIRCYCDCGPAGGGRDGCGRGGRGGNSPAGDLERQTRSQTRSVQNSSDSPVERMSRQARNAGGDKWYNKLGKFGKGAGIAGLALGGVSLVGSLASGDYRSAAGNGGALAGGAAGAAAGAALGSIVPGIGTAIGGIAGGIIGSIGGSALGTKLYDGIKSFDWEGLKSIASSTGQAVTNTWNSLKTATSNAWNGMTSGISGAITGAKNIASSTASALGSGLSSIWGGIKSVAGSAWNGVKSTLSNTMANAKTAVSSTASSLKTGLSTTWNAVKSTASTIWNNMKSDMATKTAAAKTAVSNTFTAMKNTLSSTWNGLKSLASSAWSGITGAITSSVSGAVSKASSLLGGLKNAVAGAASNVWSKITSAASKAKNFVMGSHATGLGRVPFDGYIAELHKNEAVLTASQANALRQAGILKGDGIGPQLSMPQSTSEVTGYSPLEVDPGTTMTTNTTNNNGTVRASVTINVNGTEAPEKVAVSIKDELESWFSSLGTVFPATMEG